MRVDRFGHPLRIVTEYVHPPIPVRDYDWCAWYDGFEEAQRAWGRTEAEALAALEAEDRIPYEETP